MTSKQLQPRVRSSAGLAGLALATAGFFTTALAADNRRAAAAELDMSNVTVVSVSGTIEESGFALGQRAYIDPKTKQLIEPTSEDIRIDAAAADRADQRNYLKAQPVAAFVPANAGALGMRVSREYHVYSVATRNDDGTLSEACVAGAEVAQKTLAAGGTKSNHGHQGAAHESN